MWVLKELKVSEILCVTTFDIIFTFNFDTKCVHRTMETSRPTSPRIPTTMVCPNLYIILNHSSTYRHIAHPILNNDVIQTQQSWNRLHTYKIKKEIQNMDWAWWSTQLFIRFNNGTKIENSCSKFHEKFAKVQPCNTLAIPPCTFHNTLLHFFLFTRSKE